MRKTIAYSSLVPFFAPLTIAIAPSFALAAESFDLEEVTVTAARVEKPLATIPNTITLIDSEALQQQLSINYDLSTVLGNLIPGFTPSRQKMTNAGETLRGRKPLYMIDGVPQSNPLRNGGRDGHTIDPAAIERIEVIHGANAIHGMGAAGGIINLITKTPTDQLTQSVRVDSSFQTEDIGESLSWGTTYSLSNKFDQSDLLLNLSYRSTGMGYDADGDVLGVDNTQGDTMDSQALNGLIKAGYNWSDQRVELMVNRYEVESNNDWVSVSGDVDLGIPSTSEKGAIVGEGARNNVMTLSLNYLNDDFFGQHLRLQLFRQDFEATYGAQVEPIATFQDEETYGPDLIDQSQNNSEKLGLKVTMSKDQVAKTPLNLVYGVDFLEDETWQQLIQTGRAWVPPSQYRNMAPFAQVEYVGVENLTITGGVRYEESKLKVNDFTTLASYGSQFVEGGSPEFSETLYNLGGIYRFESGWRVFANYGEALSMPDVGRVLRGINTAGQSVETFLDLIPILTENTELGVEYVHQQYRMELSYYISDSDFGQRLQRGDDGIYTVKREKTEVDGVEFSSDWIATDKDTLGLRVAFADGRYDSDADGSVDTDLGGSNIAPDRINLNWNRDWTTGFSTRLQVNNVLDKDFKNSAGEASNEFNGYTTADLTGQFDVLGGVMSIAVQNLGNTDYYTYYSQSNPNDVRNFKGLGRSYSISWRTEF